MSEPTVCAILLTADRPEYARRAIECFRAQTYPAKRLLIIDTGEAKSISVPCEVCDGGRDNILPFCPGCGLRYDPSRPAPVMEWGDWRPDLRGQSIGKLRNFAASHVTSCDVIVHFDDDDISHSNRISEQVALLQSSGADAVGYREMLFWREWRGEERLSREGVRRAVDIMSGADPHGEAWLYSQSDPRYTLGTSLCYWRKTWERCPFPPTSQGEELVFMHSGLKTVGVSSLEMMNPWATVACSCGNRYPRSGAPCSKCGVYPDDKPRMIARIHSGNTSNAYDPREMAARSEWRRVPEWDAYCRATMEGK